MKQKYEAHNEKVIETIPPESLLVWNLKDGWEPLCSFLGSFQKSFSDGYKSTLTVRFYEN